ncbi:hypothetical protein [Aliidiomarina maris]|uniref:Uncharacterized protein n=1 Tax=Aliidiomarina maris TaxID=531312 RepID=A0A327X3Y8_9GAMM|nr:hypothetical protein [Aliidiomarina maris]RAK01595.1 hypothetical protein B0I24_101218 [Aliidiomarina maris]RUO28421.1 hypothetical protein CWE07_01040 [Aliidiomarina maris]
MKFEDNPTQQQIDNTFKKTQKEGNQEGSTIEAYSLDNGFQELRIYNMDKSDKKNYYRTLPDKIWKLEQLFIPHNTGV